MEIIDGLKNLGLKEKEAKAYIALVQLGQASAYMIADRSGLKKPTTYVILDELMKKGLISRVPRKRKQLFIAKSPEEYFAVAEEKISIAKGVLPQLMAMAEEKTPKTKTLFFEGIGAVREIFLNRARKIQDKEIVGFYAHAGEETLELKEIFAGYNNELKKRGIRTRVIVPKHPNLEEYRKTDVEYGRQVKIIPFEEYSSDISIDVYDNVVMLFSIKDLQITLIENERIAKTIKQIFEITWKA